METITASLLAALIAAVKKKAAGAAADRLLEAAKVQAGKLRGLVSGKDEDIAQKLVDHVLAEAGAFPPERAIDLIPLASGTATADGSAGIWPPDNKLTIELQWVNHADFPVHVRDLEFEGRIGSDHHEYEARAGEEFVIGARATSTRMLTAHLRAGIPTPKFESGRAHVTMRIHAVVGGPWPEEPQKRRLVYDGSIHLPAYVEASNVLSGAKDVDIALDQWFTTHFDALRGSRAPRVYRYSDIDREAGVIGGSAKARIPVVARAHYYDVAEGDDTIQIRWTERAALAAPKPPPLFRR